MLPRISLHRCNREAVFNSRLNVWAASYVGAEVQGAGEVRNAPSGAVIQLSSRSPNDPEDTKKAPAQREVLFCTAGFGGAGVI